ncbi:MarR family transcriptional regulator [Heliorestis convoluta]|uniref:MarR family transcriptional regulator n=1 Tax=Heliorestis convoluta TaxID=356322 RepID=A0A5Q2N1V8_9FIRM|nr:helix-turn-helix domain-containing protein [Heliorestis convoluta]QGG46340.1 hypothetical protein FTV88_0161 [Heliorestis convoluta]
MIIRKKNTSFTLNRAIQNVNKEEDRVNDYGFSLVRFKRKNKALFSQIISENVHYLSINNYLSSPERAFLFFLSSVLEMHSNALMIPIDKTKYKKEDKNSLLGMYMTISDICRIFKISRTQASKNINALLKKGIVLEYVNSSMKEKHGRVVGERPLFLNPEIIFAGDRNRINAILAKLVMEADVLERESMKLPWKVWLSPHDEYARLVTRKKYLEYKKVQP